MKAMRIRLTDSEGKVYVWTVEHQKVTNITLGRKPRQVTGWSYRDHDGYARFVEGNWTDLVPHLHMVAANYGLTSTLS